MIQSVDLSPGEGLYEYGDQYVFIAWEAGTKLTVFYTVSKRNLTIALEFIERLKKGIIYESSKSPGSNPLPGLVNPANLDRLNHCPCQIAKPS